MLHLSLADRGLLQDPRDLPEFLPVDRKMHRADTVQMADRALVENDKRQIMSGDGLLQPFRQPVSHPSGLLAGVLLLDLADHVIAGACG